MVETTLVTSHSVPGEVRFGRSTVQFCRGLLTDVGDFSTNFAGRWGRCAVKKTHSQTDITYSFPRISQGDGAGAAAEGGAADEGGVERVGSAGQVR
jgi:hypothetical protein